MREIQLERLVEPRPPAQMPLTLQHKLRQAGQQASTRPSLAQRARSSPSALSQAEMQVLQRTLGNRAVAQLFQRDVPVQEVAQRGPPRENTTGLPDPLKAGVEALSGFSMDDVQVHYNSSRPASLEALAYTQGTEIHVAPGQEQHLAHEAWHVVQQKQRRVKPTIQAKGVTMNDDHGLEKEAEEKGEQATRGGHTRGKDVQAAFSGMENKGVIQRFDEEALRKIKAGSKPFAYIVYQPNRPDPFVIPSGVDLDVAKDSHHIHLYKDEPYACHAKWGNNAKWVIDDLSQADLDNPPHDCPEDLVDVLIVLKEIILGEHDDHPDLLEALGKIEEAEAEAEKEKKAAAVVKGKGKEGKGKGKK